VDEFIPAHLDWNAPGDRRGFRYYAGEFRRVLSELRRRKFDIGFAARGHIRDHVLLGLSGASRKVGYGVGYHRVFLTDLLGVGSSDQHKAKNWLGLLAPFGRADESASSLLAITPDELQWADSFLETHGVRAGQQLVGIHAGASVPEKRWPMDRFAAVAAALATRPELRVLAFVSPGGDGAAVADVPGVIPAKVGLRQMAALVARCTLLVCNDSGPMHIAGALGTPTIAIFGGRVARWFAPLGEGHTIITPGNGAQHLSAIPTSDVQIAIEHRLAAKKARVRA
jgi:ADP-heptose:LPS heptosyltransferase